MRASLLASATATSFGGLRLRSCASQDASAPWLSGVSEMPDDGCRAGHQYAAQALIARSRDDTEPNFPGGRMIFWRQPDPGRELPTRSEHFGGGRFHAQHRCADRADAGDSSKAPTAWVGFMPGHKFGLDLLDLCLQLGILRGMDREQLSSQAGQALIGLDAIEQRSQVNNPLGGG